MTRIFVESIEFYGFHGVPAEERVVGHRYSVDVWLSIQEEASATDEVEDTVDYGAVAELVVSVGTSGQIKTVERLARQMAEAILDLFERVEEVDITVAKRLPPAPVIAEMAGVQLTVSRSKV